MTDSLAAPGKPSTMAVLADKRNGMMGGIALMVLFILADQALLAISGQRILLWGAAFGLGVFYINALRATSESPIAMVGLTIICFWVAVAILAPEFPIADPNATSRDRLTGLFTEGKATGDMRWLGTDKTGRDALARIVWGSRRVLVWAVLATVVAYAVGMTFGVMAGYLGGWYDEVISFVANTMLAFPVMVLYILIITYMGQSGVNVIVAVTFASAPGIMRIVRGLTLDLKTRDYIAAAQTRGESPFRIMMVELLPNARGPLIVDGCLRLGYVVIAIATLGFLGLGLPPPDPDWGQMLNEGRKFALFAQSQMLVPAVALSSLILGFNLLADGLRDISLRD